MGYGGYQAKTKFRKHELTYWHSAVSALLCPRRDAVGRAQIAIAQHHHDTGPPSRTTRWCQCSRSSLGCSGSSRKRCRTPSYTDSVCSSHGNVNTFRRFKTAPSCHRSTFVQHKKSKPDQGLGPWTPRHWPPATPSSARLRTRLPPPSDLRPAALSQSHILSIQGHSDSCQGSKSPRAKGWTWKGGARGSCCGSRGRT